MDPSSVVIIVSRVFSRRKRFRAFPQPASVPRKRPFPESFRVFPRPSIYPFVKAKLVFTVTAVAAASNTVPLSVYPLLGLIRTRLTLLSTLQTHTKVTTGTY